MECDSAEIIADLVVGALLYGFYVGLSWLAYWVSGAEISSGIVWFVSFLFAYLMTNE